MYHLSDEDKKKVSPEAQYNIRTTLEDLNVSPFQRTIRDRKELKSKYLSLLLNYKINYPAELYLISDPKERSAAEQIYFMDVGLDYAKLTGPMQKVLDSECYFCGFDWTLDLHHVIHKSKKGADYPSNIINICPNCHSIIHRKIGYLVFHNKRYYVINNEYGLILRPSEIQTGINRSPPIGYNKNNKIDYIKYPDSKEVKTIYFDLYKK
jgi:5-methylcytosine-specific restriction endonuclease McrA